MASKYASFLLWRARMRNQNAAESFALRSTERLTPETPATKRSSLKKQPWVLAFASLVILGVAAGIFTYCLLRYASKDDADNIPGAVEIEMPPSRLDVFQHAAVACDAVPCAESGKQILQENGSAVDAAIATLLCMGVYNSHSMGLGGGFLMTIYEKSKEKATIIDARATAPEFSSRDMYGSNSSLSFHGGLAVAIPGEAKGYWMAHQMFGTLNWNKLFEHAINITIDGYEMGHHQAKALRKMKDLIYTSPTLRELYFDETLNHTKGVGSWITRPELGETLQALANDGPNALYEGSVAEGLVRDIEELGGNITLEDLKNYKPLLKSAINVTMKSGTRLFSTPPTGSGAILAHVLQILEGYDFDDHIEEDVTIYQRIIEATKFGYAYRHLLGDENFANVSSWMNSLLSSANAENSRMQIMDNMTFPPEYYNVKSYGGQDHGTSHVVVLAPNGDAVSATSSLNSWFGAGIRSRSTGIILNNEMHGFSIPGINDEFGYPSSPANFIAPGKRPMSSLSPSILVDSDGYPELVISAAGGMKIISALTSVIAKVLWLGEDLKTAIDAPRLHHQLIPNILEYENDFNSTILEELEIIGHNVTKTSMLESIVVGIQCYLHGNISASYDYRKGGSNAGW